MTMNELNVVRLATKPEQPATRIGSTELGCFYLKEVIGKGSYGTSYLADQLGFDRVAVVKIAHADLLTSRDAGLVRRRFAEELRAATRIQHPNLVTLYTAGETADGLPAIAMELAPGDPLEDLLAAHPDGMPPALVRPAFAQLGSALAALHGAGVVHRDLSPRNVILNQGPPVEVKVLDFGVAKLSGRPRLTYGAVGTPRYMAPEQVIGRAVAASDIFALGAMLWWALTGQEYRCEALTIEDINDATRDPLRVADPRTIDERIPAEIANLVSRMLAHGEQRRPSAEEFCKRWTRVSIQLRPRVRRRPHQVLPPPVTPPSSGSISAPPSFGSLPTTSRSQPARNAAGPRVMVVDANPITQHLVVGCLRRAGCRVRGSADPRDATRSSPGSFDLVVVSTEVPDADAIDIARYLQEYHCGEWVVLTGQGSLDDRMKEVGVRDLVSVPADFERLSGLVDLLRGELTLRESSRPTTTDAVDREALERLRDADPQMLQEAIELFLGQTPESLARISESHDRSDLESIRDECRSLSTSARALGASHLARLAHAAAELVREGDHGCIPGFVTEMEREYGLVFRALMDVHATTFRHESIR